MHCRIHTHGRGTRGSHVKCNHVSLFASAALQAWLTSEQTQGEQTWFAVRADLEYDAAGTELPCNVRCVAALAIAAQMLQTATEN